MRYRACLLLVCGYWPFATLGGPKPASGLLRRDTIVVDNVSGETQVRSLGVGLRRYTNNVRLRHQGTVIVCDEAIHQVATSRVIAHGHVRLMRGDSIQISGDSALYDGTNRQITLRSRVLFRHRQTELTTHWLDYSLLTGVVRYAGGSRLTDGPNVLTSRKGRYNARTRQLMAYQQVALKTPYTTLRADSLWYTATDTPIPTIDFAQAIYVDETELVRHLPNGKQPARVAEKAPSRTPLPSPANALTPSQAVARAVPHAEQPIRLPVRPVTAAAVVDEESELERLLNRPK